MIMLGMTSATALYGEKSVCWPTYATIICRRDDEHKRMHGVQPEPRGPDLIADLLPMRLIGCISALRVAALVGGHSAVSGTLWLQMLSLSPWVITCQSQRVAQRPRRP
jgi:hypothetical protein